MKNCTVLLFGLLLCNVLGAQLNMTYKSNVTYNENLNDVWGYVAPDDREYALIGLRNGVSIVDVTDTENPVIKGYANGPSSTWRDIKTFGNFAYVTNETSDGLLVIDLSNLPNELTENDYWYWLPDLPNLGQMTSCHNIFVDEFGYGYLVGCDVNTGGMIYIDLFTNPGNPTFIDAGPPIYAHDIYVRDNIAYNSEIYEGSFTAYDVTDKSNTIGLGGHTTPFDFTHNLWLSDDSNFAFTTDELPDAPVAAYDISDLNDIKEIDQFRPLQTLGEGVTPHNVHVWNDWLIVSYYTDGCIIVDGARPHNLVEVGNFDTFLPQDMSLGAWGAYPYLPSGTILVSDMGNGCYILEPNYVRACYLEGKVTDLATGANIQGVSIDINTSELNQSSTGFTGDYATGLATAGTYEVTFSHPAYESFTTSAVLDNGVVTILDVQLGAIPVFDLGAQVIDAETGDPINDAEVLITRQGEVFPLTTDVNGNVALPSAFGGIYDMYAQKWGYIINSIELNNDGSSPANNIIELQRGYADDFFFDLDWDVSGTAESGIWERGEPIGTFVNGGNTGSNPQFDIENDLGDLCFVTGNGGGSVGNDDVDNGYTQLITPLMDLENYNEPIVRFHYWFFNGGGDGNPNDNVTVSLDNGTEVVVLETFSTSTSQWIEVEINFSGIIALTNTMSIIFEASDQVIDNNGHLVEAGVDAFEVFDANPTATFELDESLLQLKAMPNPFSNTLTVDYQFEAIPNQATLHIYNILGQEVENIQLNESRGIIEINTIRENGIYLLQIEADGHLMKALRVVKQ